MPLFSKRSKKQSRQVEVTVFTGEVPLEVKGEASYQKALELIAGPKTDSGHSHDCVGVLVREPKNPYDQNAIAVHAEDGRGNAILVGYVNRADAARLAPAIDRLNAAGTQVAMEATIIGGWDRGDGDEGHYGIWLRYDPTDFGLD